MSAPRCLYAVQVVAPWTPATAMTFGHLAGLIGKYGEGLSRSDMAYLLGQWTHGLLTLVPHAQKGLWDFWGDHDTKSEELFEEWRASFDLSEVRREPLPLGGDYREPAKPRFGLATVALLLARGAYGTQTIGGVCDSVAPPVDRTIKRDSLAAVVRPLAGLSPACVGAAVMFVAPKQPDHALTEGDLAGPVYEYLYDVR